MCLLQNKTIWILNEVWSRLVDLTRVAWVYLLKGQKGHGRGGILREAAQAEHERRRKPYVLGMWKIIDLDVKKFSWQLPKWIEIFIKQLY